MKCELLAPAGNPEKCQLALLYGADAVYLGGKEFSLRSYAGNFTETELAEAVQTAHARGKRVYVCANIFARDADFAVLERYFRFLAEAGADGALVSDLGVFRVLRRVAPELPVHVSTQANTLNREAAAFWYDEGAERVVLGRELSLDEIAEIHAYVPALALEAFVHGAMCVSYSGRCYLSDYLRGRPSNRGECAQPCRDPYFLATRDGTLLGAEEDGRGTYLLNSKDLDMSAHLTALAEAGVSSFKIEGRMKSEYYLATVVNCYRRILDMGWSPQLSAELETVTHREYTTAYAFGEATETMAFSGSQKAGTCDFIAIVRGREGGRVLVEMRTRFHEGDVLEILSPDEHFQKRFSVAALRGPDGLPTDDAKLVQGLYTMDCPYPLSAGTILRRRR